jgi:hypothetical protein
MSLLLLLLLLLPHPSSWCRLLHMRGKRLGMMCTLG